MKLRESGMPAEDYWETLLNPPMILSRFPLDRMTGEVVELGCGYGTFTLPLAQRIAGRVHAFDIDEAMLARTAERAASARLKNILVIQRDVFSVGYGLQDESCDAGLLFNILHGESPIDLLRETARVVRIGGTVAVIHWRTDVQTPRGPSPDIRPMPQQIIEWAKTAGGLSLAEGPFELPPYHYGLSFTRVVSSGHDALAAQYSIIRQAGDVAIQL
jgi:SAM-dependent methyltransferase